MTNTVVLSILSLAYLALAVCCAVTYELRRGSKIKIVHLPGWLFWLGAVCGAVFLGFGWLAAKDESGIAVVLGFGAIALLGMSLMLGWKNCCITYDKQGFTHKNLIAVRRTYTYDQLTARAKLKGQSLTFVFYAGDKKISFDVVSRNAADFMITLQSEYRKRHNKNMPEIQKSKNQPGGFRDHVHNPGEYLAIFIMMLLFVGGVGLWLVLDTWLPLNEKDGEQFNLTFYEWKIDEEYLWLTTSEYDEPFKIAICEEHFTGLRSITEKCDGSTEFTIWAERFTPDGGPVYRVYAISADGREYLGFEDSTACQREGLPLVLGIFAVFMAVLLGASGIIYAVGSNPAKYPKWLVYACFQKYAIDIW